MLYPGLRKQLISRDSAHGLCFWDPSCGLVGPSLLGSETALPRRLPGRLSEDSPAAGSRVLQGYPFNGPGDLIPQEYLTGAGTEYVEPCLKAVFADGARCPADL